MSLDTLLDEWRTYLLSRREIRPGDVDELEDHLRGQVASLRETGLDDEEAFLVAVRRLGTLDELSREFAREHSERLWKQLLVESGRDDGIGLRGMLGWAIGAAVVVQLPRLLAADLDTATSFYVRNLALILLPLLLGYFAWSRRVSPRRLIGPVVVFAVGAGLANLYPFARFGSTEILTGVHLLVVGWFAVGVAYLAGDWRGADSRMDFVRFTGEWFIYYVLIALGGGVLVALTVGVFSAIGVDASLFVSEWVIPSGAAGAVLVAAWLVESKQAVVENLAPVLTNVFSPLFAAMFLASVGAMLWTGHGVDVGRDVLILFDVLLVVVLGLLLYSVSARDPLTEPALPDVIHLVLVLSALVVDVFALVAILGRITDMGFTPNRTAALGLNLVLLANLAWSAWLSLSFLRHRRPFSDLERWQTGYLPIFALWSALVVIVFPPLFGFV